MRQYRGLTEDGKWVYGSLVKIVGKSYIVLVGATLLHSLLPIPYTRLIEVVPETVGQYTGLCYEGDYVGMDCWNGGDGIDEPNHHDVFEGVVIYDKKICRFGLQTKLCDEGQIEVGLEDSQFTSLEVNGNKWEKQE